MFMPYDNIPPKYKVLKGQYSFEEYSLKQEFKRASKWKT